MAKPTHKDCGCYWSAQIQFTAAELAELHAVCDSPAFIDAVADIAGDCRAGLEFSQKLPTPGHIRRQMTAIAEQANQLRQSLRALHWMPAGLIELASPYPDLSKMERELVFLQVAASGAAKKFTKTRFGKSNAKREAAWRLRQVFHRHGLAFTGFDFHEDKATTGGPAARCLRVIFGVNSRTRVGHWIAAALEYPQFLLVSDNPTLD